MCGIAGIVSSSPVPDQLLPSFLKALRHRGPDDEGTYLSPDRTVGLAHTRLSILDLSPAGHQPMTNEDGTLWIVYNGEIYNYGELREELGAKGHRFTSKTDTEVILHLYEEEGEVAVQRLNGMFAFVIYDRPRNSLFLVRDRLGIKPLYYADYNGVFLFASEIKAILAAGLVPVQVDWQAISDYFTFGFVPHPETAFQHIRQLPPACILQLNLKSGTQRIQTYWTPWDENRPHPGRRSAEAYKEQIRTLLTDSVRRERVSDVPLGVFFSGGIDSTLLTALMVRESPEKVKTFTVGFQGRGLQPEDDLTYARIASRALGTEHHELMVDLTKADEFLEMVRHFDQPFANPTSYLQYLIAKETRRHVKVALSGVGGDELFGGYPRYRMFPLAPVLGRLPRGPARVLRRMLSVVREDTWEPTLRQAKRLLRGVGYDLPEQYVQWSYYLTEEEKKRLLKVPGSVQLQPTSRIAREALTQVSEDVDHYGRFFTMDLKTWLVDNLLDYTDKASMAVALEVRVPFLDHRLVEMSTQIPFRDKVRGGKLKYLLKETFRDLLPREILQAPKRGFSPPIVQWVDAVFDRYFDEVLTQRVVEQGGIFSWEIIQELRQAHRLRRQNVYMELLSIIMFDAWFRRYIQT